ncbi:MAG TPA: hypothetical protein VIN59_02730 [Alphaproteobacteria bacterium]
MRVGAACMIGAGSTLIQNVKIGDLSLIAAGSVVRVDTPENAFLQA